MRIVLTGTDVVISDQLRAYTEYRLFKSVARYRNLIRGVAVSLRQHGGSADCFFCSVIVDLGPSGRIKTQSRGRHPNAAIDGAADRTASVLAQHSSQLISS